MYNIHNGHGGGALGKLWVMVIAKAKFVQMNAYPNHKINGDRLVQGEVYTQYKNIHVMTIKVSSCSFVPRQPLSLSLPLPPLPPHLWYAEQLWIYRGIYIFRVP